MLLLHLLNFRIRTYFIQTSHGYRVVNKCSTTPVRWLLVSARVVRTFAVGSVHPTGSCSLQQTVSYHMLSDRIYRYRDLL